MKKILFILFAISLLFVGCDERDVRVQTISVKVNATDWKYTDFPNNNYFYAGVSMPEITENVFDYGEVKAYVVYDRFDINNARKNILPYVAHKESLLDEQWYFYTETIDFTYGIGWAEFNFRASDFAYEEDLSINPPAMEFDIVITYPQE